MKKAARVIVLMAAMTVGPLGAAVPQASACDKPINNGCAGAGQCKIVGLDLESPTVPHLECTY
jgi:hypothetical protein